MPSHALIELCLWNDSKLCYLLLFSKTPSLYFVTFEDEQQEPYVSKYYWFSVFEFWQKNFP